MTFEQLVDRQNVLYVPIYSMISHETGLINLTCDGNVNRWLTAFYKAKTYDKLTIVCPNEESTVNHTKFIQMTSHLYNDRQLLLYETNLVSKSALFQRGNEFADAMFEKIKKDPGFDSSLIIVEGQGLAKKLVQDDSRKFKIAYWCPVCQTNRKSRSFMKQDDKLTNEYLFSAVDYVIVATDEQVEYLDQCGVDCAKVIQQSTFIDRSMPMFSKYDIDDETVTQVNKYPVSLYLPFRLSDEGYQIWKIITATADCDIPIFCPNVNQSTNEELFKLCQKNDQNITKDIFDAFLGKLQNITSDRDTYYSVIDHCKNVIIPYFEDTSFIMHAAVDELLLGSPKPVCHIMINSDDLTNFFKNQKKYEYTR